MALFTVWPKAPYAYVWATNKADHKQTKAYPHHGLRVISIWQNAWYEIEEPPVLDGRTLSGNNFWVRQSDVSLNPPEDIQDPLPTPDPIPTYGVSDEQAANAIVTILKYLRQ